MLSPFFFSEGGGSSVSQGPVADTKSNRPGSLGGPGPTLAEISLRIVASSQVVSHRHGFPKHTHAAARAANGRDGLGEEHHPQQYPAADPKKSNGPPGSFDWKNSEIDLKLRPPSVVFQSTSPFGHISSVLYCSYLDTLLSMCGIELTVRQPCVSPCNVRRAETQARIPRRHRVNST
jgi:hypothetical protein